MDNKKGYEAENVSDALCEALEPLLGEFLDGYVLMGIRADNEKRLVIIKHGPKDIQYSMLTALAAAKDWSGL